MDSDDLHHSVCTIAIGGDIQGTGFLVTTNNVVTCSHVVAGCHGLDPCKPLPPGIVVECQFGAAHPANGEVLASTALGGLGGDICILRLSDTQALIAVPPFRSHRDAESTGIMGCVDPATGAISWVSTVQRMAIAPDRVQVDVAEWHQMNVVRGLSGAPVWSERGSAVVGMFTDVADLVNNKPTPPRSGLFTPMPYIARVGAEWIRLEDLEQALSGTASRNLLLGMLLCLNSSPDPALRQQVVSHVGRLVSPEVAREIGFGFAAELVDTFLDLATSPDESTPIASRLADALTEAEIPVSQFRSWYLSTHSAAATGSKLHSFAAEPSPTMIAEFESRCSSVLVAHTCAIGAVQLVPMKVGWGSTDDASDGQPRVSVSVPHNDKIGQALLVKRWQPAGSDLIAAALAGVTAAVELLRTLRVPIEDLERIQYCEVELNGLLPPTVLAGSGCGLAIALSALSQVTRLVLPPKIFAGSLSSGLVAKLPPEETAAIAEAIRSDGLVESLVANVGETVDCDRIDRIHGDSLQSAAEACWGQEWTSWLEVLGAKHLPNCFMRLGWDDLFEQGHIRTSDDEVLDVLYPQAMNIAQDFDNGTVRTHVILGSARSGKTTLAYQVGNELERVGWHRVVLSTFDGGPHTTMQVTEAIELALRRARSARTLVIVDGLEWGDGLDDLEGAVREFATRENVAILLTIHSERESDVTFEETSSTALLWTQDHLLSFLSRAAQEKPSLAASLPLVGKVASEKNAGGDIGIALHLLLAIAAGETQGTGISQYLLQNRLGSVSEETLGELKALAAHSTLGSSYPISDWGDFEPHSISAVKTNGLWRIRSEVVSEVLLRATRTTDGWKSSNRPIIEIAMEILLRDPNVISEGLPRFLRYVSTYRANELERVVGDLGGRLENWIVSTTDPYGLAMVIRAVSSVIEEGLLAEALSRLVVLLTNALRDGDRSPYWVKSCLFVLTRNHSLASGVAFTENKESESTAWMQLGDVLAGRLPKLIKRLWYTRQQVQFLELAERLRLSAVNRRIASIAPSIVARIETGAQARAAHSILDQAQRLIARATRLAASREERNRLQSQSQELEAAIGSALDNKNEPANVDTFLARQTVQWRIDKKWINYRDEGHAIAPIVHRLLASSSLNQVRSGISTLINYDRPAAIGLLSTRVNNASLGEIMASQSRFKCGGADIGDVATFVDVIAKTHGDTALRFLYDWHGDDLVASKQLLGVLVRKAHRSSDVKSVGRLLRSVARFDQEWGIVERSFSRSFADGMGEQWFREALTSEQRSSLLFYVIDGLILTQSSLFKTLLPVVVHTISEDARTAVKHWPTRLALRLLEVEELAESATNLVCEAIPEEVIRERLRVARNIQTFANLHQLAGLHPALPASLAISLREEGLGRVGQRVARSGSPDIFAQAYRAIATTLRRAEGSAGTLRAHARLSGLCQLKLKYADSTGASLQAIDILRRVDPVGCSRALQFKVIRRWIDGTSDPYEAVRLLTVADKARRGLGRLVLDDFLKSKSGERLLDDIRFMQQPQAQAYCYSHLAQLGYVPDEEVQRSIYHRWWNSLGKITSPVALAELLRMYLAWDSSLAREATEAMRWGRVLERIAEGAFGILNGVPRLAGVLYAARLDDMAKQTLHAVKLSDVSVGRTGFETLSGIVSVLSLVDQDRCAELVRRLEPEVIATVVRSLPALDEDYWTTFGWFAQTAASVGVPLCLATRPVSWEYRKTAGTELWALGWTEPSDWWKLDELLDQAIEEVNSFAATGIEQGALPSIAPGIARVAACHMMFRGEESTSSLLNLIVDSDLRAREACTLAWVAAERETPLGTIDWDLLVPLEFRRRPAWCGNPYARACERLIDLTLTTEE